MGACPDFDSISTEDLNTTMIKQVLSDMGVISWDETELNKSTRPDCNKALTSHYLYKKFMEVQETDDGGCDYKFANMRATRTANSSSSSCATLATRARWAR